MDSIAAYGALIISLLTIAGGGARYLLERRRRDRAQDIDGIGNLLARIKDLDGVIAELQAERDKDYVERAEIRRELWATQARVNQLETAQNGMLRIITVALEYIEVLSAQVVKMGGQPPPKPQEIASWLKVNNGGSK